MLLEVQIESELCLDFDCFSPNPKFHLNKIQTATLYFKTRMKEQVEQEEQEKEDRLYFQTLETLVAINIVSKSFNMHVSSSGIRHLFIISVNEFQEILNGSLLPDAAGA